MQDQILVIGATGSIGSPLVQQLATEGYRVKAATRHPQAYSPRANVTAVRFDYDQPATFTEALAGVTQVFMTTPPTDFVPEESLNPFIDLARIAGVKQIVLVTALGAERAGDDLVYRRVERHLMASGVDYTILRPGWLMQSLTSGFILATIQKQNSICLPAGDAQISYIDAHDIAAVAAATLTEDRHLGQEYALTGGKALGFAQTAEIISNAAGRPIQYVDVSLEELRGIVADVGGYPGPVELMERFFRSAKRGSYAVISPVVSVLLGRAPITLEQFSSANAALWQAE